MHVAGHSTLIQKLIFKVSSVYLAYYPRSRSANDFCICSTIRGSDQSFSLHSQAKLVGQTIVIQRSSRYSNHPTLHIIMLSLQDWHRMYTASRQSASWTPCLSWFKNAGQLWTYWQRTTFYCSTGCWNFDFKFSRQCCERGGPVTTGLFCTYTHIKTNTSFYLSLICVEIPSID